MSENKNSVVVGDNVVITRAQLRRVEKQYSRRPGGMPSLYKEARDIMGPDPAPVKKTKPAPKSRRNSRSTNAFSEDYLAKVKAELGLASKDRRRERRVASKRRRHYDE